MRDRHWIGCAILVAGLLCMGQAAPPANPSGDALKALAAHWAALKDVRTLEARFVCEKRLAALDTPLESAGRVWISKTGGVRFSTEKPYVSELILTAGKVYARSQHETQWTKTNQSSRPGLTAVMTELGSWSTGDMAKIADLYAVTTGPQTAPPPLPPDASNPTDANDEQAPVDVFLLTPTNPDLLKAVKQITLALDRTTHLLRYVEIETRQTDRTRYWFFDVKTNIALPADIFQATEGSGQGAGSMVPGGGNG